MDPTRVGGPTNHLLTDGGLSLVIGDATKGTGNAALTQVSVWFAPPTQRHRLQLLPAAAVSGLPRCLRAPEVGEHIVCAGDPARARARRQPGQGAAVRIQPHWPPVHRPGPGEVHPGPRMRGVQADLRVEEHPGARAGCCVRGGGIHCLQMRLTQKARAAVETNCNACKLFIPELQQC